MEIRLLVVENVHGSKQTSLHFDSVCFFFLNIAQNTCNTLIRKYVIILANRSGEE